MYGCGEITLQNGNDIVEGFGTSFLTYVAVGSILRKDEIEYYVVEVLSDTSIRLHHKYVGTTELEVRYRIERARPPQWYYSFNINTLQWSIDEAKLYEHFKAQVNKLASEKILSRYSEVKQRNSLARWLELQTTGPDDSSEISEARAMWGWIKKIKVASDEVNTQMLAASGITEREQKLADFKEVIDVI